METRKVSVQLKGYAQAIVYGNAIIEVPADATDDELEKCLSGELVVSALESEPLWQLDHLYEDEVEVDDDIEEIEEAVSESEPEAVFTRDEGGDFCVAVMRGDFDV